MWDPSYISPKWLRSARKRPKHSKQKIMDLVSQAIIDSGFREPECSHYVNEDNLLRPYHGFKFRSGDFIMTRSHRLTPARPRGFKNQHEVSLVFQRRDPKMTITSAMLSTQDLKDIEERIEELIRASKVLRRFVNDYVIPHLYRPPNGRMFLRELRKFNSLLGSSN